MKWQMEYPTQESPDAQQYGGTVDVKFPQGVAFSPATSVLPSLML